MAALQKRGAQAGDSGGRGVILAGDVGGTKTYVGLFVARGGRPRPVRVERFVNRDFSGIYAVMSAFLGKAGGRGITGAALGIACPVAKNAGTLTNLSWRIDGAALGRRLGTGSVHLMNDLVAIGRGIGLLAEKDLLVLQKGRAAKGNAAVIAAGTGLGEAMLLRDGERSLPVASEGGHADFAPVAKAEVELMEYLKERFGHASYERVLSGPGLKNVYDFLKARGAVREPPGLAEMFKGNKDAAEVIFNSAVNDGERGCKMALEIFASVYGREAGNLALRSMAAGGVYLGGGIAPKIFKLPGLRRVFLSSFSDKGRFKGFLRGVPVSVILNDMTALYGAAAFAAGPAGR